MNTKKPKKAWSSKAVKGKLLSSLFHEGRTSLRRLIDAISSEMQGVLDYVDGRADIRTASSALENISDLIDRGKNQRIDADLTPFHLFQWVQDKKQSPFFPKLQMEVADGQKYLDRLLAAISNADSALAQYVLGREDISRLQQEVRNITVACDDLNNLLQKGPHDGQELASLMDGSVKADNFEGWMREVDEILEAFGGHMELVDAPYRDMYDAGDLPANAVYTVLTAWNDMPPDLASQYVEGFRSLKATTLDQWIVNTSGALLAILRPTRDKDYKKRALQVLKDAKRVGEREDGKGEEGFADILDVYDFVERYVEQDKVQDALRLLEDINRTHGSVKAVDADSSKDIVKDMMHLLTRSNRNRAMDMGWRDFQATYSETDQRVYLKFKSGMKSPGIRMVQLTYDYGKDLYEIEMYTNGWQRKLEEAEGVYVDQVGEIIERWYYASF